VRPGWQTALASFGGLNPCPDMPITVNGRSVALAFVGVGMVISVALSKLAWERLPVQALLIFPALGIVGITATALLNLGITPAYTGFFTVAIFFIGSTQSERVTLASILIALPCWVICQGGLTATVGVKVPVTVGV